MLRLDELSSELVDRLRQTSEAIQRQAAITACHFAQAHSNLQDPQFLEAFRRLQNRESFSPDERSQIETLVQHLDDQYFDLYEVAEEKLEAIENPSAEE